MKRIVTRPAFASNCLALIADIHRTGKGIIVTHKGEPFLVVRPTKKKKSRLLATRKKVKRR